MLSPEELHRLERLLPLRALPWRVGDMYAVGLANLVGFALIVVAWYGAHNATDPDAHAVWMNLAVTGLVVALAGNVVWLLTGLREVGTVRRSLLGITPEDEKRVPVARAVAADADALVTAKDMTRYHRAGCPLVAGKAVTKRTARQHLAAGRQPCGVCRPDEAAA